MTHKRTSAGLIAGLAAALASALWLGGALGLGVLLGFLLGGALAISGVAWQAHWLRVRPARALRAQLEAFLVKLVALSVFTLLFRGIAPLSERVDWRAFAVAFAAAVAWLLPLGTWENSLRATPRTRPAAPAPTRSGA